MINEGVPFAWAGRLWDHDWVGRHSDLDSVDHHRDLGLVDRHSDLCSVDHHLGLDLVGLRWVHLYWVGHHRGLGLVDCHLGHGRGPSGDPHVMGLSGDHLGHRWVHEKEGHLGHVKEDLQGRD